MKREPYFLTYKIIYIFNSSIVTLPTTNKKAYHKKKDYITKQVAA